MSLTAPAVSWQVLSPTSLSLSITGTEGDTVLTRWRCLPVQSTDRSGPSRTGDGTLTLDDLPAGACLLITVQRQSSGGVLSYPYAFPATCATGDSLAGALGRAWALSAALPEACGQLFSQEAPEKLLSQKLTLPWTILSYDRSSYDWTTEAIYYETTHAELTTYTLGRQLAEDAATAIHNHLDWQGLPFEDHKTLAVLVEPVDFSVGSTFLRHRTGTIVWSCCLSYSVTIERHHPRWQTYIPG